MKSAFAAVLIGCVTLAHGQELNSEVPGHLQGMRDWYERQIQQTKEAYLIELNRTREVYSNSGQQDRVKELDEEIARVKNVIPASEIIGKPLPTKKEELMDFLHGTTWSIRYGSTAGKEEYQMTFNKNGTLKLDSGRVSKLQVYGWKTIRLWAYDTATMSDQFNYFTSVDANGKLYYGVLLPLKEKLSASL